jgi:hypothetical protein
MLSSDQLVRIAKEVALNLPPSLKSKEALDARREMKREIAEMTRRGIGIELPFEIPDIGG